MNMHMFLELVRMTGRDQQIVLARDSASKAILSILLSLIYKDYAEIRKKLNRLTRFTQFSSKL